MTSQLAVNALANAVALRRPAGTVVHPVPLPCLRPRPARRRADRVHGPGWSLRRQRRDGVVLRAAAEDRPEPPPLVGHPPGPAPGDRHLNREDLPPPTPPRPPRTPDAHRVRDTAPSRLRGMNAPYRNGSTGVGGSPPQRPPLKVSPPDGAVERASLSHLRSMLGAAAGGLEPNPCRARPPSPTTSRVLSQHRRSRAGASRQRTVSIAQ